MQSFPEIRQFIQGEWRRGSGKSVETVLNPATARPLTEFAHAGLGDIDDALDAAGESARRWRNTAPEERYRILRRAADLLRSRVEAAAPLLSLEQGKPLAESRAEIAASADILDWYAEEGRRAYGRIVPGAPGTRLMVTAEPVGPVAAFTPWNFPATTVTRKVGGALAAGCTIIVKASEETPATAVAVFECLAEAGLPLGVANLVFGVPAQISERMLKSPVLRKVSLTGSIGVGRTLGHLAVDHDLVTTMELGGNAPVIVFDDVDVEAVATACASAKFRNAGQVCNAPSRFYVHERVADRFIECAAAFAAALRVGPGVQPSTQMGALANRRRLDAMIEFADDARSRGATVLCAGNRPEGDGYFFAPTVIAEVPDNAKVMTDEVFGPIMPITRFLDVDDVIRRANDTTYGLGSFVFTASLERATLVSDALEAGLVGVNTTVLSRPETPFGGIKASGHGYESGVEGVEAYLRRKAILQHPPIHSA
ncbi:NAD-dependent succinate-semialdehyde dehydrogenase [Paraburkholderia sp. JPY432]|uniref:NAD-dependent succinate-semialdehyde dehydrogenase n=1 Tax=Paraburkholderia youngii TaxID=2782701 RepID=UPI0015960920|nr:NAD-dependent succinate-semialdehyde dehydrogenase [Paraburkholderia youngii]NVH75765.1 NAD-dependent succinate-semialdehyde dehydrogenase [Paraburkholderia youngii]